MDRLRSVAKGQGTRYGEECVPDGRHSLRRESLQFRRVGQPCHLRPQLEWRLSTRESFQGRSVYREVGTELGYSVVQVGGLTRTQPRLVAHPLRKHPQGVPPFPHRSCAGFLSYLLVPVAAEGEWEIPAADRGRGRERYRWMADRERRLM